MAVLIVLILLVLALMAYNRVWFGQPYVRLQRELDRAWDDHVWFIREFIATCVGGGDVGGAANRVLQSQKKIVEPLARYWDTAALEAAIDARGSLIVTLTNLMLKAQDGQNETYQELYANADKIGKCLCALGITSGRRLSRDFADAAYRLISAKIRGDDDIPPFLDLQAAALTLSHILGVVTARSFPQWFLFDLTA